LTNPQIDRRHVPALLQWIYARVAPSEKKEFKRLLAQLQANEERRQRAEQEEAAKRREAEPEERTTNSNSDSFVQKRPKTGVTR
jgi:hypothetical protein